MSSLNYIYYNELSLDDENNFIINITESNEVDNNKFIAGEEYLLSMCRLKPKKEDYISKWVDCDIINDLWKKSTMQERKKRCLTLQ